MSKILIIGAGASGLMAAALLGESGHEVHLFEKNEKCGKKLYITGKGRCNLTNACDRDTLFSSVISNPRFLYSAFDACCPEDVMAFFESEGLKLKVERGRRVFPVSDHSSDVIRTLEGCARRRGVRFHLGTNVTGLLVCQGRAAGIRLQNAETVPADAVVVASGGLSYPSTGSTGDGLKFALETGHTVTECTPSLVPLLTKEDYIPRMAGLSLKNTGFTLYRGKKVLYRDFGEMMFTHTGVTGPMILSASAHMKGIPQGEELRAVLDLKPALSPEQLDARLLREFSASPNRQIRNVIAPLFPASLVPVIIRVMQIPQDKPAREVTRQERKALAALIKAFPFTVTGKGSFQEAVITQGGVSVKEISPSTMESRKVPGLYFIGEVLDLDALTGGFNLQIAWSTAWSCASALMK